MNPTPRHSIVKGAVVTLFFASIGIYATAQQLRALSLLWTGDDEVIEDVQTVDEKPYPEVMPQENTPEPASPNTQETQGAQEAQWFGVDLGPAASWQEIIAYYAKHKASIDAATSSMTWVPFDPATQPYLQTPSSAVEPQRPVVENSPNQSQSHEGQILDYSSGTPVWVPLPGEASGIVPVSEAMGILAQNEIYVGSEDSCTIGTTADDAAIQEQQIFVSDDGQVIAYAVDKYDSEGTPWQHTFVYDRKKRQTLKIGNYLFGMSGNGRFVGVDNAIYDRQTGSFRDFTTEGLGGMDYANISNDGNFVTAKIGIYGTSEHFIGLFNVHDRTMINLGLGQNMQMSSDGRYIVYDHHLTGDGGVNAMPPQIPIEDNIGIILYDREKNIAEYLSKSIELPEDAFAPQWLEELWLAFTASPDLRYIYFREFGSEYVTIDRVTRQKIPGSPLNQDQGFVPSTRAQTMVIANNANMIIQAPSGVPRAIFNPINQTTTDLPYNLDGGEPINGGSDFLNISGDGQTIVYRAGGGMGPHTIRIYDMRTKETDVAAPGADCSTMDIDSPPTRPERDPRPWNPISLQNDETEHIMFTR